jgi:hypothetical protein
VPAGKQQTNLSKQIPEDVRERTEKAGVKKVDWYAGRLDVLEGQSLKASDPAERDELRRVAANYRQASRQTRKHERLQKLRAIMGRLPRPGRTRHAA